MIVQKANAKINIGLDIKGLREDRYHEIDTIMQTVELADRITFTEKEKGIHFWCDDSTIKQNENIAYKAAKLFMKEMEIKQGVKIDLYKTIPSCAGLGGGSADAAAVIRGLNSLFRTGLTFADMEKMGRILGADVSFCIKGGTQRATGKGDVLNVVKDFTDVWFLIIKPKENVETEWAYKQYDKLVDCERPDMDMLQQLIEKRDIEGFRDKAVNVFEQAVIKHKPSIKEAKEDLETTSPVALFMTGSGSSVVAMYDQMKNASMAYITLSKKYIDIFITKTTDGLK